MVCELEVWDNPVLVQSCLSLLIKMTMVPPLSGSWLSILLRIARKCMVYAQQGRQGWTMEIQPQTELPLLLGGNLGALRRQPCTCVPG